MSAGFMFNVGPEPIVPPPRELPEVPPPELPEVPDPFGLDELLPLPFPELPELPHVADDARDGFAGWWDMFPLPELPELPPPPAGDYR